MKSEKLLTSASTRPRMRTNRIPFVFMASVLWVPSVCAQSADNSIAIRTQSAQGCPLPALPNANQVALLRWYRANVVTDFVTGGGPNGIVFDGSSVWIVNAPLNSVSKVRASDGATLGTFSVGTVPGYAAFDGANIWVTNLGDNTVSKLRVSDGVTLGTFP